MRSFEYLIRDDATGNQTWVAAPSLREALIRRENELRAAATMETDHFRMGTNARPKPPLPAKAKASQYSSGDLVDVSLADVSCRGRVASVIRQKAE